MCSARIHTNGMTIVKRTNEHLHDPDEQQIECITLKVGVKRNAETQIIALTTSLDIPLNQLS